MDAPSGQGSRSTFACKLTHWCDYETTLEFMMAQWNWKGTTSTVPLAKPLLPKNECISA